MFNRTLSTTTRTVANRVKQAAAANVRGAARAFTTIPAHVTKTGAGKKWAVVVATAAASAGAACLNTEVQADAAVDQTYAKLRARIEAIMEDENSVNPSIDAAPGAKGGGGDIGPMLVRLAWHCAGTYSAAEQNGGSDGATMRFKPEADHGGNAGLGHARGLLEPLKKEFPSVTYADLYIFAGCVAIEAMGGPQLAFRPGRTDATGAADPKKDSRNSPDGRLPDGAGMPVPADKHLRDIFCRMGFDDREIVALSGAHSMGRCHTDRSGFWGPWSYSPSTMSNEYFRLLEEEKWSLKKTHNGAKWTGPEQFENEKGDLMMLYTDMALVWDPSFRVHVQAYKANEDLFFDDFAKAWVKLTELGCKNLAKEAIANVSGKAVAKAWYQFW